MPKSFNAICKTITPGNIENVEMLVKSLPCREMMRDEASEIIKKRWGEYEKGYFFKSASQLARQLGLYYFVEGVYIPRFHSIPTNIEIKKYLNYWIDHYYAPNPYTETKEHPNLQPKLIVFELFKLVQANGQISWDDAEKEIFGEVTSTSDRLRNIISSLSNLIEIKNGIVSVGQGADKTLFQQLSDTEFNNNKDDRKAFFEWFHGYESIEDYIEKDKPNNELNSDNETEKLQLEKSRRGQGVFRESLFNEFQFCPLTLCNDSRLLIASHIKPWSASSNSERLNPKNGFLFTPTIDKLFDRGLISFESDKSILISDEIDQENKKKLNLVEGEIIDNLPIDGREEYLRYHRENIFIN